MALILESGEVSDGACPSFLILSLLSLATALASSQLATQARCRLVTQTIASLSYSFALL